MAMESCDEMSVPKMSTSGDGDSGDLNRDNVGALGFQNSPQRKQILSFFNKESLSTKSLQFVPEYEVLLQTEVDSSKVADSMLWQKQQECSCPYQILLVNVEASPWESVLFLQQLKTNNKVKCLYDHVALVSAHDLICKESWSLLSEALGRDICDVSGESLLLLVYDFSNDLLVQGSVLDGLLDNSLIPNCSVVLTCNKSMCIGTPTMPVKELKKTQKTDEEVCREIAHLLYPESSGSNKTVDYIIYNCIGLFSNLKLVEIVLKLFKKKPPRTLAIMMEAVVLYLIHSGASSISALPTKTYAKLMPYCKLAYLTLFNGDGIDVWDVSKCLTLDAENGGFNASANAGMDLLRLPFDGVKGKCTFLHLLIQEFLAAYFLARKPLLSQISIFERKNYLSDPKFFEFCTFYFGIEHMILSSSIQNKDFSSNEVHYVYNHILASASSKSYINDVQLFKILDQTQNPDIVRNIFASKDIIFSLDTTKLSDSLVTTLTYVISNSGISDWLVSSHKNMKNTTDFIAMLVKNNSSRKVSVSTRTISEGKFIAKPKNMKNITPKTSNSDNTFVKLLRKVIHRILQLFSPIKIKSSSSETSYVSFLACECLKKKFDEVKFLNFEPIQALHWLKSPLVEQNIKKMSGKSSREVKEYQEHLSRHHGMEQLELVIMVAPLPERLYYSEPHSSVKKCIELYKLDTDRSYFKPIVETSDGTFVDFKPPSCTFPSQDEAPKQPVGIETGYMSLLAKMVVPELPIPQSNMNATYDKNSPTKPMDTPVYDVAPKGLAGYQPADNVTHKDSIVSRAKKVSPTSTSEFKLARARANNIGYGEQAENMAATEVAAAQESGRNSRSQIQRQVAVEAGTVLYSTMPGVFAVDVRYPCPGETNLIKRGGNGSIYAINHGEYEFAVKKTPYRSREIEIHKILKHPNVVEMKCLMFGHPQPEHRRRYFSYHYMSRYSGDLSRMVTNKPEMTMLNLNEQFKGNPRLLGSMQGNWKYILKEVLKGLGYMHGHRVVHRDMKCSNILIKIFCDCENILTCTCSFKYNVCLADFDAALRLNSEGHIPPMPAVPSRHHLTGPPVYQVVPVGTDGYRAPESAQVVLASHASAFDPPLTEKADIWSVGLIMIRMLNGANGPTGQQKVS